MRETQLRRSCVVIKICSRGIWILYYLNLLAEMIIKAGTQSMKTVLPTINKTIQTGCFLFCLIQGCIVGSLVYANETDNPVVSHAAIPKIYKQLHGAAINGSAEAQFQLGLIFEYGRGVNQDDSVATSWYEKSAAQGFTDAQYRLAVLSDNGWGKAPNKEVAFKHYKNAAENGHELAQHDLAIMYFKGAGTDKNLLQAYKWLKIAVLNGNALMQKHLSLVAQEMSAVEIQIAENLANSWMERFSVQF